MTDMSALDRDLMIRTVLAEAGNQPAQGQAAVAHVINNRVTSGKYGGSTPHEVILAKSQFEPVSDHTSSFYTAQPGDPAYQQAAQIVDGVNSGAIKDPTGGATHFLNAATVRGRGTYGNANGLPDWAQGTPIATIGAHSFYAPNGAVGAGAGSATPGATPSSSTPAMPSTASTPSAPAQGATPLLDAKIASLSNQIGHDAGVAPQQRGLIPRVLFGDQPGAPPQKGLFGAIPTPNNGLGLLGSLFKPQGAPAASPSVPPPAPALSPATPVPPPAPVQSAPLPPPVPAVAQATPTPSAPTPGATPAQPTPGAAQGAPQTPGQQASAAPANPDLLASLQGLFGGTSSS
ncbi:MAG: cell wall hydrolase [Methylocella sp.]